MQIYGNQGVIKMGLLDIFRKKKSAEKPQELQRFLLPSKSENNESDVKIEDIEKIATARMNLPIYARQVNESIQIISNTTNPNTFFYRYGFIIERLTEMEEMQKCINAKGNVLEVKQSLINDKDKHIVLLIKRMFEKTKEKIATLKNQYDIEHNIDEFIYLVENFKEEMGELSEKYFNEVTKYLKTKYINNSNTETKQQTPENQSVSAEEKTDSDINNNQKQNVNLNTEENYNSASYREERLKEIKKTIEKSYPSRNGLKIPEIMVLDYAETFTTAAKDIHNFWYYDFGFEIEDIHNTLDMLMKKELIQIAPVKEMIKKFTIPKIKEILKELGLKQSGKKAELLDRLFENTSDEYLESKVTEKGFVITDSGKRELKENDYVLYFHRRNYVYCINFTVWQMNKLLHDNPDKNYREIMWEEFQKKYNTESHEIRINGYRKYTAVCNDMCTFLLESHGNAETALKYFAESVYYEVNYNLPEQYSLYMSRGKSVHQLKIYDFVYIDEKNFNKIINELDISDDEFCRRLGDIFFGFHVEKPLLSDTDTAKFVVAKIKKDYETLDKMEYVIDTCDTGETETFTGFDFTETDKRAIEKLEQKGRSKPQIRYYSSKWEIK